MKEGHQSLFFSDESLQAKKLEEVKAPPKISPLASNTLGIDSLLLVTKEELDLIASGMNGKQFKLDLLMRGSEHGFKAATFHELCDSKGPTLSLIKSEAGKVFGGYSAVSWSSLDGKYFADPAAFVFSLSTKKLFRQHRYKGYAVQHDKQHLMVFGRGNDICIYDNCDSRKESFSSMGDTYEIPPGTTYDTYSAKSYMAGDCLFRVKEIEVFKVFIL